MQKIGTNPNTGNSVVFSGGEGEWEKACQYDDEMQAEYEYQQKIVDDWKQAVRIASICDHDEPEEEATRRIAKQYGIDEDEVWYICQIGPR